MVSDKVRVVVAGAAGRMGQEVVRAVSAADGLELVGATDRSHVDESTRTLCGPDVTDVRISNRLGALLDEVGADVLVDFTIAGVAPSNALSALQRKVAPIIGTSGLSFEDQNAIRQATEDYQTPAILVPNFAVGAVLMMKFAEMAAPYLPYCEVLEMHHEQKLDSPSGTAVHTADIISQARTESVSDPEGTFEKVKGARGANHKGIPVHSVRLPGFVASQEVIFGGAGERLSLRHDSIDRKSFMGGVILACREVRKHQGFLVGLDKLMF